MFEVNVSKHIQCPVRQLFLFVGDFKNDEQWWPAVIDAKSLSPEQGVGARFWQKNRVLGISYDIMFTVEEYVLDRKIVYSSDKSALAFKATYLFAEEAAGSTITFIATVEANNPIFKLVHPIFKRVIERMTNQNFNTLKRILEQQAATGLESHSLH